MVSESIKNSAFRIIDASFNRAMEGFRVVEEFTRMHLNDRLLSKSVKQLRHDLVEAVSQCPGDSLLACRDILHDVGTTVQTKSEYQRDSIDNIVRANFGRVLQSLRSIEEYAKLAMPEISQDVEAIRYQAYAVEKVVVRVLASIEDLKSASVYVLTDTRESLAEFEKLIIQLIEAEVDLIQLRDKRLEDRDLIAAGKLLTKLTRGSISRWIMNDRADLAVVCDADGVHVGQSDLDVAEARRIVGVGKMVGVSTHNFEQARDAIMAGADYIGVGPVFPSTTKSFLQFASQQFVERVMNEITLPAFAIGGINELNIEQLIEINVSRVAVSGAVINSDDPSEIIRVIKQKLMASCETC